MEINRILTNGDASLVALNGSLRDARSGGAGLNTQFGLPNVEANNIDLAAYCAVPNVATKCGNVGARAPPARPTTTSATTSRSTPATATRSTRPPSIVGRVGIEAGTTSIVTETDRRAERPDRAVAQRQRRASRVREHATQGDDLNLDPPVRVRHDRADAEPQTRS